MSKGRRRGCPSLRKKEQLSPTTTCVFLLGPGCQQGKNLPLPIKSPDRDGKLLQNTPRCTQKHWLTSYLAIPPSSRADIGIRHHGSPKPISGVFHKSKGACVSINIATDCLPFIKSRIVLSVCHSPLHLRGTTTLISFI
jgi:hypothetical protein